MKDSNKDITLRREPKSKKTTVIIVVILALIVIAQGIKIYLDHKERVTMENQLANTEEELASTLQRLTDVNEELTQKIAEIEELGGDVEDLKKAKAEVESELARTRARDRKAIAELKSRVDGYQTLLKAKDEEIVRLKSMNDVLMTENTSLKTEKNQLFDSLNIISESKEKLAGKVAIASQLKAENIKLTAVNSRGKERDMPVKARQLDKLRVTFNIAENNVAPIEGKQILVRIVDGQGQVIFDVAKGSGTFLFEGKEEFYTASKEILFDNSRQQLTFEYEKGSDYEEGVYRLEVYTPEYKMGTVQFEVK